MIDLAFTFGVGVVIGGLIAWIVASWVWCVREDGEWCKMPVEGDGSDAEPMGMVEGKP